MLLLNFILSVLLALPILAFFTLAERKVIASVQRRRGPNVPTEFLAVVLFSVHPISLNSLFHTLLDLWGFVLALWPLWVLLILLRVSRFIWKLYSAKLISAYFKALFCTWLHPWVSSVFVLSNMAVFLLFHIAGYSHMWFNVKPFGIETTLILAVYSLWGLLVIRLTVPGLLRSYTIVTSQYVTVLVLFYYINWDALLLLLASGTVNWFYPPGTGDELPSTTKVSPSPNVTAPSNNLGGTGVELPKTQNALPGPAVSPTPKNSGVTNSVSSPVSAEIASNNVLIVEDAALSKGPTKQSLSHIHQRPDGSLEVWSVTSGPTGRSAVKQVIDADGKPSAYKVIYPERGGSVEVIDYDALARNPSLPLKVITLSDEDLVNTQAAANQSPPKVSGNTTNINSPLLTSSSQGASGSNIRQDPSFQRDESDDLDDDSSVNSDSLMLSPTQSSPVAQASPSSQSSPSVAPPQLPANPESDNAFMKWVKQIIEPFIDSYRTSAEKLANFYNQHPTATVVSVGAVSGFAAFKRSNALIKWMSGVRTGDVIKWRGRVTANYGFFGLWKRIEITVDQASSVGGNLDEWASRLVPNQLFNQLRHGTHNPALMRRIMRGRFIFGTFSGICAASLTYIYGEYTLSVKSVKKSSAQ